MWNVVDGVYRCTYNGPILLLGADHANPARRRHHANWQHDDPAHALVRELLSSLFKLEAAGPVSASELGEDGNKVEAAMDRFVVLGLFAYDDPHSAYIVSGEHYAGAVAVKLSDASYYETKLFRRLKAETKTAWFEV